MINRFARSMGDVYDNPEKLVVNHDYAIGLFNYRKALEEIYHSEPEEPEPCETYKVEAPAPPKKPRVSRALMAERKIRRLEDYIVLLKTEIKRLAAVQVRRERRRPQQVARPNKTWSDGTKPDFCPTCNGYGLVEKK